MKGLRGLTLIELMVMLVLAVIVISIVVGAISGGGLPTTICEIVCNAPGLDADHYR